MLRLLAAATMIGLLATSPAGAAITVYHDFASYNTAVGGVHTTVISFDVDANNNPINPSEDSNNDGSFDIEGNTFSNVVRYSTPSMGSTRVNIANIGDPIVNEVGPFGTWTGSLRWEYTSDYFATAFTGVDMEPSTSLRIYQNGQLIDSALVQGNGGLFEFFGFVSTNSFDAVEVDGDFYAIDDHRSTSDIATPTEENTWGAVKAHFVSR